MDGKSESNPLNARDANRRGRKYQRNRKRKNKNKNKNVGSKQRSFVAFLSSTLIPTGKAKAHMAARAQAFKDREKLHKGEFEEVKRQLFCLCVVLFIIGLSSFGMAGYMVFE